MEMEEKEIRCFQCHCEITTKDNGLCINQDTPHEMYQCDDCHYAEFGVKIMANLLVFKPKNQTQPNPLNFNPMPHDKKEVGTSFKFILQALTLIKEKKENKGIIECPKCKGEVIYTRASLNGHVHGKCKTENCLSWMM